MSYSTTAYGWGQRQIIRFGGNPAPMTGIVVPYQDLNDGISWFADAIEDENNHVQNKAAQYSYLAEGVWLSQDFVGRKLSIPFKYDEGGGRAFHVAKAILTQSGEQFLTFDNTTALRVRCMGFGKTKMYNDAPPYVFEGAIEFESRNPFLEDLNPTFVSLSGILAHVIYLGDTPAKPIVIVNCTGGTALLANNTSGEQCSWNPTFGNGNYTINTQNFTVTGPAGQPIQMQGSFPFLYHGFPSPAQNDLATFNCTLVSVSFSNRYEL